MTDAGEPNSTVAVQIDGSGPLDDVGRDVRRVSVFSAVLGVSFFVALALVVGSVVIEIPYFSLEPGDTFETEEYVAVDGVDSFTSPGEVSFVTVTQRRLTPFTWALSSLRDSDQIFHEDLILGDQTIDEQREENAFLMLTSQNNAIASALEHLGYETAVPAGVVIIDIVEGGSLDGVFARNDVITEVNGVEITEAIQLFELLADPTVETAEIIAARPGTEPRTHQVDLTNETRGFLGVAGGEDLNGEPGAYLSEIIAGGASEGSLEAGDRIISFEGAEIASFEDLIPALADRVAGDVISLEVQRGVEVLPFDIELGTRAFERAGIFSADTQFRDAELPFDVEFTTEEIGGPSAGLAFTLTVLDVLTAGDLTGGANIVVTGSIDRNGNVGTVGGVHQKSFAALEDEADIFIVPEANFETASAAVGDQLRVESVNTLEEALLIIDEFGGNAADLPTDGSL